MSLKKRSREVITYTPYQVGCLKAPLGRKARPPAAVDDLGVSAMSGTGDPKLISESSDACGRLGVEFPSLSCRLLDAGGDSLDTAGDLGMTVGS